MTLEAAKKMDGGCVSNWLIDVYLSPAEAFNTYSYEQQKELAHDAIVLLRESEPVRHGRWIKMTGMMPPEYHGHYQCSECQWHMKGIRSSWTREEELTYCPNCGAIMDGGGDVER